MVMIEYSKEIEEKQKKFLAMSEEEFDKYMCELYPIMFKERNLPMNQTCMCWGFNIGRGWQWILANLCEQLEFINKETGINVVFEQIKEKFGGARFYFRTELDESCGIKYAQYQEKAVFWRNIISLMINSAEESCDYYCAGCGETKHDMITIGGWVFDLCEKCLEKDKNRREGLKAWREKKELKNTAIEMMYRGNKEEIDQLKKLVKSFSSRISKEDKKRQKEYDKSLKASKKELEKALLLAKKKVSNAPDKK